jgi:DNA-binding transcriptional LysR family regulator
MELRHLRYFVAVAEELSFTRAAERLYTAQPSLSTQIRSLEEELGVQLFERDKKRVYLTQAGRHLLDRARVILSSVQTTKEEVQSAATGIIGKLSIGFTASAMLNAALPLAVRSFKLTFPSVVLHMIEMTSLHQLDGIHHRSLDLGVLRRPNIGIPTGVTVEEWNSTPLIAAIPSEHPLAKKKGLYIRELKDMPLIVYPRDAGIGLYWKVLDLCAKFGFRPKVLQEARDATTMIGLVASGFGVAIVPNGSQCIHLVGVIYRPILDTDAVSGLYLGYRDADVNPHLDSILRVLRSTMAAEKKQLLTIDFPGAPGLEVS